jgi:hypothetical protein
VGWLDLVALRYGVALNDGVDALAVTGLDRLRGLPSIRVCTAYDYTGSQTALDACFQWQRLSGRDRSAARTTVGGEFPALALSIREVGA